MNYKIFNPNLINSVILYQRGNSFAHSWTGVPLDKRLSAYTAYIMEEATNAPDMYIDSYSRGSIDVLKSPVVYVSPSSKISRDSLRRSGYKIVLDPKKAVTTIIPYMEESLKFNFDMLVVKGADVLLISYKRPYQTGVPISDDELKRLKDYIETIWQAFDDNTLFKDTNGTLYLMPRNEMFESLAQGEAEDCNFVYDTNVKLQASIDITPETLLIWSSENNNDLLCKLILNSNWQEYPFTVRTFIFHCSHSLQYYHTSSFEVLRKALQLNSDSPDFIITPKDWNMLQDYIMLRLGVPKEGGSVAPSAYSELHYGYKKIIGERVYVRPFRLKEDTRYQDAMQLAAKF